MTDKKGKTKDTKETAADAPKKGGRSIVLSEGPGKGMKRVDYIRQEFAKGRKRGEIAKELGIVYQIVFAATKTPKTDDAAAAVKGNDDKKAA